MTRTVWISCIFCVHSLFWHETQPWLPRPPQLPAVTAAMAAATAAAAAAAIIAQRWRWLGGKK